MKRFGGFEFFHNLNSLTKSNPFNESVISQINRFINLTNQSSISNAQKIASLFEINPPQISVSQKNKQTKSCKFLSHFLLRFGITTKVGQRVLHSLIFLITHFFVRFSSIKIHPRHLMNTELRQLIIRYLKLKFNSILNYKIVLASKCSQLSASYLLLHSFRLVFSYFLLMNVLQHRNIYNSSVAFVVSPIGGRISFGI